MKLWPTLLLCTLSLWAAAAEAAPSPLNLAAAPAADLFVPDMQRHALPDPTLAQTLFRRQGKGNGNGGGNGGKGKKDDDDDEAPTPPPPRPPPQPAPAPPPPVAVPPQQPQPAPQPLPQPEPQPAPQTVPQPDPNLPRPGSPQVPSAPSDPSTTPPPPIGSGPVITTQPPKPGPLIIPPSSNKSPSTSPPSSNPNTANTPSSGVSTPTSNSNATSSENPTLKIALTVAGVLVVAGTLLLSVRLYNAKRQSSSSSVAPETVSSNHKTLFGLGNPPSTAVAGKKQVDDVETGLKKEALQWSAKPKKHVGFEENVEAMETGSTRSVDSIIFVEGEETVKAMAHLPSLMSLDRAPPPALLHVNDVGKGGMKEDVRASVRSLQSIGQAGGEVVRKGTDLSFISGMSAEDFHTIYDEIKEEEEGNA
ncbi:hypothetical protein HDV05_000115 [Chytridiales sp. JEL 0842]|nr:hypothetical protein HDV05_000115 [Chytridiales sp. JEL 0842]